MKREELIRQELILELVDVWGFPRGLMIVERGLASLPHLQGKKLPQRRCDLLCLAKEEQEGVYPLLLIECKVLPLSQTAVEQVLGYNYYVQSCFIAIANGQELIVWDREGVVVKHGLLSYAECVQQAVARREKSLSRI